MLVGELIDKLSKVDRNFQVVPSFHTENEIDIELVFVSNENVTAIVLTDDPPLVVQRLNSVRGNRAFHIKE
jgi:hypothetical protein